MVQGPAGIGKTSLLEPPRPRAAGPRGRGGPRLASGGRVRLGRRPPAPRAAAAGHDTRSRARARLGGAAALAEPVVLPDARRAAGGAGPVVRRAARPLLARRGGSPHARPQLLVVDDLQWADAASARFLDFLANRLDALPVLLLVARRPAAGARALRGAAATLLGRRRSRSAGTAARARGADGGRRAPRARLPRGHRRQPAAPPAARSTGSASAAPPPRRGGAVGPGAMADAVAGTLAPPRRGARAAGARGRGAGHGAAGRRRAPRGLRHEDGAAASPRSSRRRPPARRPPARVRARARARRRARRAARRGPRAAARRAPRACSRTRRRAEAVAVHLLQAEPAGDRAAAATLAAAGRGALASGARRGRRLLRARARRAAAGRRRAACCSTSPRRARRRAPEALDQSSRPTRCRRCRAARARPCSALVWASGPGGRTRRGARWSRAHRRRGRPRPGARARARALRLAAMFMSHGCCAARSARPSASPASGADPGECELLPQVGDPPLPRRPLGGRRGGAARARGRGIPALVAAIGAGSPGFPFVVGPALQGRPARAAPHPRRRQLAEARRRGSRPGSPRRRVARVDRAARGRRGGGGGRRARGPRGVPDGTWHAPCAPRAWSSVLVERAALDEAQAVLDAAWRDGADPDVGRPALSTRSILRAARATRPAPSPTSSSRAGGSAPSPIPIPTSRRLRIARLLQRPAATRPRARESRRSAGAGRACGHAGPHRAGADRRRARHAAARRAWSSCARPSASSSAHRRAASWPGRSSSSARRCAARGERTAAREPLRRALDLARRGRARRDRRAGGEELRVTGARVRRPAVSGLGSLTPSERRIVDLAARRRGQPARSRRRSS